MVDKCGLAARAWKLELTDTSTKVDMATIHTIVGECPNTNFGTSFSPIDRNKGHHDSGLTNHTNIVVHGDNNIAHNTNPDKLVSDNPYLCGHPGAVTPPKGGCNWDFETTIAAAYPGDVNNALKQFRYVSLPDPVDPCSTTTDCTTTSGTVCGTAWKKGVDLNEQMKIGQCGYLRGYWSANQICGVTDGQFPGNSFVDCTGGNLKLYKCNDNIASCYNQAAATTSCCGCVDWKQDKDINVIQKACPLLVPLIEESYENEPETKSILEKYLKTLKESNIDTVILGCTHYGWLQNLIQELLGKDINVMDSGKVVAFKLEEYLKKHKEIVKEGDGKRIFLTTDSDRKFNKAAKKFLGRDIKSKIINITI